MELNRRRYLTAIGTTASALALAGCSGGDDSGNGTNDGTSTETQTNTGTEYEQGSKEAMLLSVEAFPDGWTRNDEINQNFDAVFTNGDQSIVVLATVEIFADVAGAEDRIETAQAGVSEPNDYPIADEAFWATRNDQIACTMFRHSNAVGQVCATRESGSGVVPDQSRSQQYAEMLYQEW
jgi:hypothetical protein